MLMQQSDYIRKYKCVKYEKKKEKFRLDAKSRIHEIDHQPEILDYIIISFIFFNLFFV